jgi:hypothetical protein
MHRLKNIIHIEFIDSIEFPCDGVFEFRIGRHDIPSLKINIKAKGIGSRI